MCQRIKTCRLALLSWSKTQSRPTKKRIEQLRTISSELEKACQENPGDTEAFRKRSTARKDLNEMLAKEESYWHQRSRVSWMREGDRNTRFFHANATQRRQKNKINGLRETNGRLVTTHAAMVSVAQWNIFVGYSLPPIRKP